MESGYTRPAAKAKPVSLSSRSVNSAKLRTRITSRGCSASASIRGLAEAIQILDDRLRRVAAELGVLAQSDAVRSLVLPQAGSGFVGSVAVRFRYDVCKTGGGCE